MYWEKHLSNNRDLRSFIFVLIQIIYIRLAILIKLQQPMLSFIDNFILRPSSSSSSLQLPFKVISFFFFVYGWLHFTLEINLGYWGKITRTNQGRIFESVACVDNFPVTFKFLKTKLIDL